MGCAAAVAAVVLVRDDMVLPDESALLYALGVLSSRLGCGIATVARALGVLSIDRNDAHSTGTPIV